MHMHAVNTRSSGKTAGGGGLTAHWPILKQAQTTYKKIT
jgi:hypothetical protein